jgi:hypothetical protein
LRDGAEKHGENEGGGQHLRVERGHIGNLHAQILGHEPSPI